MAEPQPLVDSPKKRVEKLLDQVLAQPYRKKQATEANAVNGGKNKRRKSISVRYPGLPEANNQCLWGIAHGISKSYKFFTYDVLENLQLRPKLLEFNRMTDETDYNKQADLLVGAYRRVNDMVQQTRTAEVKKIRALLKDKIAGDNLVTQEALNQVHLDSFFDAEYEEATDTVKELFLFVYSDCPEGMSANIASKTGKKVDQGRYETMVSRADISLIRLVLWLEVVKKEWKAQEAAEGTDEEGGGNGQRRQSRRNQNQENNESNSNQEEAVVNGNTEADVNKEKSKGGRPAKTPSVEKYIPKFEEYLLEEVKMRVSAAKKEALAQSWYDAALENINKKVKSQKDQNKKSMPDLNPAGGNTNETSSTTPRVSQSLLADIMKEEVGDWAKV